MEVSSKTIKFISVLVVSLGSFGLAEVVSHWSFDNISDSLIIDEQGTVNGFVSGSPQYEAGALQQSLFLDGSSYVKFPHNGHFNFGSFSFSAWVKPISTSIMPVLEYGEEGVGYLNTGVHLWVNSTGWASNVQGGVQFNVMIENASRYRNLTSSSNLIRPNEWSHVVVTFDQDKGKAKIYHDCNLEREEVYSNEPSLTSPDTLYLGWRPQYSDHWLSNTYFSGQIDEVKVFDGALSDKDVSKLYREVRPNTKVCPDPDRRIRTRRRCHIRARVKHKSGQPIEEVSIVRPLKSLLLRNEEEGVSEKVFERGDSIMISSLFEDESGKYEHFSNTQFAEVVETSDSTWEVYFEDSPKNLSDLDLDDVVIELEEVPAPVLRVSGAAKVEKFAAFFSNGKLRVSHLTEGMDVQIVDVRGDLVWEGRTDYDRIDVGNLGSGLYIVKVVIKDAHLLAKVVVP